MESFDQLRAIYDSRVPQYKSAVASLALVRDQSNLRLLRGALRFERSQLPTDERIDYGSYVLLRLDMTPESALKFAENLSSGATPRDFDFLVEEKYELSHPTSFHGRGLPPFPVGRKRFSKWPGIMSILTYRAIRVNEPLGPVVKLDLPPIIDPSQHINEWVGVDPKSMSELHNGVAIIFPDFRARISLVRFEENEVVVEVEPMLVSREGLKVKSALCSSDQCQEVSVEESGDHYRVPIQRIPSRFYFFVLDSESEEVIDWAEVYTSWSELPPEVEFALPGQQIAHLVDQGETETVEFKVNIGDGFRLIQTIVAFANTKGGVVLVGVDDNGKVDGTDPSADRDKVQEWIEQRCDPPLTVVFTPVLLQSKQVLVIQVPPGPNPPYMHRDNGIIYVRRNATDRPARRPEVDGFYSGGHSPSGW